MLDTFITFSTIEQDYSSYEANPAASAVSIVLAVIAIIALWVTFNKAGRHGWAAIIPIYNVYTLVKTAGRPGWWTILYFIPLVGIVIHIIIALDLAKRFGKGGAFGFFLLFLLPIIGFSIIAFGKAEYTAPPVV